MRKTSREKDLQWRGQGWRSLDLIPGKEKVLGSDKKGRNSLFRKRLAFFFGTLLSSTLGTGVGERAWWLECISRAYPGLTQRRGLRPHCAVIIPLTWGWGSGLAQGSGFLSGQWGGRDWASPMSSHIYYIFLSLWKRLSLRRILVETYWSDEMDPQVPSLSPSQTHYGPRREAEIQLTKASKIVRNKVLGGIVWTSKVLSRSQGVSVCWPVPKLSPGRFMEMNYLSLITTLYLMHIWGYLRVTSVLCSEVAPGGARRPYIVLGIVPRSAAYKART